ncbi:MAG: DNA methyltransferase [Ignavibacteria bacterium]
MSVKVIIGDSRKMVEISDESIGLVVTSPPYWNIKDYGIDGQLGYGQTLYEYLKDLYRVWKECYRVLKPGRRLCINIGDQFARSIIYGRYKIIPLHAEIISQCEEIGFDYMGSIIWQKKTTMNTTGGATIMGSYPYPPNGMIEIDYEFILVFKKPGNSEHVSKDIKEQSILTKEEWKDYFIGHWNFGGAKQIGHEAMFPDELPLRLIKMFTFVGDTVLDPFLGSGTTIKAARQLRRNAIGYEINEDYLSLIKEKINNQNDLFSSNEKIEIVKRFHNPSIEPISYQPRIQDAKPNIEPNKLNFKKDSLYKVTQIVKENALRLNTGLTIKFLGIEIVDSKAASQYLEESVLKKEVYLKFDPQNLPSGEPVEAYVYLKNKILINAYLIKSGIAIADKKVNHKYKSKFLELEKLYLCQKNGS